LHDTDADLMSRAGDGDRVAWQLLYVRHRKFVYETALRFLDDEATARDTAQEVFVSLFSHAAAYRSTAKFHAFLRKMTVNRCINVRSSARNRRNVESPDEVLATVPSHESDPATRLEREQTAAAVRAAVAALPARQRMAVILSRFEGLSYEDIAQAMECSVASVESLLFRARRSLADALSGT
jgi:RNA polymerase sigma-70 factor (ECF subfamily)